MGDDAETIEYWFGDGAGDVSRWTSPSSHGTLLLDFDGDGRVDDAMIDLDGDRRADVAALDLDDDGTAETRHRDDGSGLWAVVESGPSNCPAPGGPEPGQGAPSKPEPDARVTPVPAEPGQPPRQAVIDADADGDPDVLLFDNDGDGTADGAVPTGPAGPTPAPVGTPQAR